MICFPNAKINIGLEILRKRPDGFHDIDTLFYPLQFSDVLEVVTSKSFLFQQSGLVIDGDPEQNLVVKAYRLMQQVFRLPPVNIHLHKIIPFGAGLGGGSSDATHMLRMLVDLFKLKISSADLSQMALQLGSDCPFFLQNKPLMASGRGEVFSEFTALQLKGFTLLLITPPINVSTAMAYAGVKASEPAIPLLERLKEPVETWKNTIENQFEINVFKSFPELAAYKKKLYESGAIYASMSGSGAALYGLYQAAPSQAAKLFSDCGIWMENIQ